MKHSHATEVNSLKSAGVPTDEASSDAPITIHVALASGHSMQVKIPNSNVSELKSAVKKALGVRFLHPGRQNA